MITAILIGSVAGVIAGTLVDRHALKREQRDWALLGNQALITIGQTACQMIEVALESAAPSGPPFDPAGTEPRGHALDAAGRVLIEQAGLFRDMLLPWLSVLIKLEESEFVARCEGFADRLSVIGRSRSTSEGDLRRLRDDHEFFSSRLRRPLLAQAQSTLGDVIDDVSAVERSNDQLRADYQRNISLILEQDRKAREELARWRASIGTTERNPPPSVESSDE